MEKMKVGLDDLEVLRKRRMQSRNYYVSSQMDEFTCEGKANVVHYNGARTKDYMFGVSKMEEKVSCRYMVNGYLGSINGGS